MTLFSSISSVSFTETHSNVHTVCAAHHSAICLPFLYVQPPKFSISTEDCNGQLTYVSAGGVQDAHGTLA